MITRHAAAKQPDIAELIGQFRELLEDISEWNTPTDGADKYREVRKTLCNDPKVRQLLPLFVVECRTVRQFWDYIRTLRTYKERRGYIQGQLLPVERHFRPEQSRAPGFQPPEIRYEYSPVRPTPTTDQLYIAGSRIAELRSLRSPKFDFCKLVRICEELNVAYSENCFYGVAMLSRSMLDHVPPIFGMSSFAQVASNCAGQRSFKELMTQLDQGMRKIADLHLHSQIRKKETLPVDQQVNFKPQVDMLLTEIIRISS